MRIRKLVLCICAISVISCLWVGIGLAETNSQNANYPTIQNCEMTLPTEIFEVHSTASIPTNNDLNYFNTQTGWGNIKTETFEGDFPNDWKILHNSIDSYWGKTDYNAFTGSWSCFCSQAGSAASLPGMDYKGNMQTWMIYGPFSLEDADSATVEFWHWTKTRSSSDYFRWSVSINYNNFYGSGIYGNWTDNTGNINGWMNVKFDLTAVPQLGNLSGQSQVWVAFIFQSDSYLHDDGVYIDDIKIDVHSKPNPIISINPIEISTTLAPATKDSLTFEISNSGEGDLNYNIYLNSVPPTASVAKQNTLSIEHILQANYNQAVANHQSPAKYSIGEIKLDTRNITPTLAEPIKWQPILENSNADANPIHIAVVDGGGTSLSPITDIWDYINLHWNSFGSRQIVIDYSTLNKEDITYQDIVATGADALIISNNWGSTDIESCDALNETECNAIVQYVEEGHGLYMSGGTFNDASNQNSSFQVDKLGALVGINTIFSYAWRSGTNKTPIDIMENNHPIWRNIHNNYTCSFYSSNTLPDFTENWNYSIVDGEMLGLSSDTEKIVVGKSNRIYCSSLPECNLFGITLDDYQFIYNTIMYISSSSIDWLSVEPLAGKVEAGNSQEVKLLLNASDLSEGTYEAFLDIDNNSINNASITVPVTLTVQVTRPTPEHFTNVVTATGKTQPVYITNAMLNGELLEAEDEIAIFDGDLLVGAIVLPSPLQFPLSDALIAFIQYQSPVSELLPGAVEGHAMSFKVWQKSTNLELPASISNIVAGSAQFQEGLVTALELSATTSQTCDIVLQPNTPNLISFPVTLEIPDPAIIFSACTNLVSVADDNGHFYIPADIAFAGHPGSNTIGAINSTEGYIVYLDGDSTHTLSISGEPLVTENLIYTLHANKLNHISYPFMQEYNVEAFFNAAPLAEHLVIILDDNGNVYIPENVVSPGHPGSNTIGKMQPGKGYMLFHSAQQNINFTYPFPSNQAQKTQVAFSAAKKSFRFTVTTSETPHIFYVENLVDFGEIADEIAFYQNDKCIGAQVITEMQNPVTVWLDDENAPISACIWHSKSQQTGNVTFAQQPDLTSGIISQIELAGSSSDVENIQVPDKTTLYENYPNPFNPETTIRFYLKTASQINIQIFNVRGELIRTLYNSDLQNGFHEIHWDGKSDLQISVAGGLYFVRLKTENTQLLQKMTLVK